MSLAYSIILVCCQSENNIMYIKLYIIKYLIMMANILYTMQLPNLLTNTNAYPVLDIWPHLTLYFNDRSLSSRIIVYTWFFSSVLKIAAAAHRCTSLAFLLQHPNKLTQLKSDKQFIHSQESNDLQHCNLTFYSISYLPFYHKMDIKV